MTWQRHEPGSQQWGTNAPPQVARTKLCIIQVLPLKHYDSCTGITSQWHLSSDPRTSTFYKYRIFYILKKYWIYLKQLGAHPVRRGENDLWVPQTTDKCQKLHKMVGEFGLKKSKSLVWPVHSYAPAAPSLQRAPERKAIILFLLCC